MRRAKLITVFIAAAALTATMGMAEGPGNGRQGPGQEMEGGPWEARILFAIQNADLLKDAGIPEAKQTQLQEMARDSMKKIIKLKADLQVIMLDLTTEMQKDKIDLKKVDELIGQKAKTEAEIDKEVFLTIAEGLNKLTTEEREKLREIIQSGRDEMREHWQDRKDKPGR